jgi:hypothetical protein
MIEAICERLANGETLKSICSDVDMPNYVTVWRWEQEDAEFCKLSARAREAGTHHMADDCIQIADNPSIDPADKRVRIDTRIRLIGKWNAKRYGDSTQIKHADADGNKLSVGNVLGAISGSTAGLPRTDEVPE